ncbi:MAG TPA: hypothetical protein VFX73_01935 [Chitinophagaceae bacterium]|jgi:phosphate/sulfate permease|nr:hypothetical protein [Chitinophagaceae bacterium]
MDVPKFIVGGLLGGVINFFMGWLVWGILLMDYIGKHTTNATVFRSEEGMIFWAMILSNLLFGFLIAYILYVANVRTARSGAIIGAIAGALMVAAFDLGIYAQMDVYDTGVFLPDMLASAVVTGIVGAAIGWYYGRGPLTKAV